MMTIKTEDRPTLFSELKAGDVFVFIAAPDCPYIKTIKNYSIEEECRECGEEVAVDMEDFCVELETGAFCKANSWEKVILYKNAELVLSR